MTRDLDIAALKALLEKEERDGQESFDKEKISETAGKLRAFYEAYLSDENLAPGMLVVWKPGLKNKKRPKVDEPMVVLSILDTPVYANDEGPGSTYFREPLDLIGGILDSDGDFTIFHFDRRRFTPFQE